MTHSKTFDNLIPNLNIQTNFVAPNWAPGFQCNKGECGLCCITQLPSGVPQIFIKEIDMAICRLYNLKTKSCKKYHERPDGCRTYPFSFGFEEDHITIFASLECPGTNSEKEIEGEILANILNQEDNIKALIQMKDIYYQASTNPNIWGNSHNLWIFLKEKIRMFFDELDGFPFLNNLINLIWNESAIFYDQKLEKKLKVPLSKIYKRSEGIYISSRFQKHQLGIVESKGSKVFVYLFDKNLKIIKRVKIRNPLKNFELDLDKKAKELLLEYVSLNSIRPFLSLATRRTFLNAEPVPFNLIRSICGSYISLESGAILFSMRDGVETINEEAMKELIRFNEGNLHSFFVNPSKIHVN